MKMKKFLVLLLSFLTISTIMVACGNNEITLQDFPATYSEEVQLGDVYTLQVLNVLDKDGNEYRVTADVKTAQGEAVNVISNQFDIDNIEGYVITYTAKISEKNSVNSVLTLTVIDKEGPIIRITKPNDGIVGVEYTLPEITVTDLSGETVTPVIKVYFVNGEAREEVALTDNKFTPSKNGVYVIEVTAADSSNNSNSKEETFAVYNPASVGEIANFDYAETANKLSSNKALAFDYVSPEENQDESYDGGYVEMSYDGANTWVNTFLVPRQEKAAYADFDTISAWVYPVLANDAKASCFFSFFNLLDYQVTVNSGEWTKVSFSAQKFLDTYDNLVNKSQIFIPFNYNNPISANHANLVAFRLGDVFMHKYAEFEVTVDDDNFLSEGETTTEVVLTVGSTHEAVPAHVLKVYDSESTLLEAASKDGNVYTYTLPMGEYTYTVESKDSVYVGSTSGSFTVESRTQIRKEETPTDFVAGTPVTLPDAQVWVDGVVTDNVANKSAKYVYAADNTEEVIEGNTFTPSASGKIVVTYTYPDAVALTMEYGVARGAINNRYVLDSSNRDMMFDIESKKTGSAYSETYVNDGEKPYVAISVISPIVGSNWVVVPISPKNNMTELANFEFVRVEVYYVANPGLVKGLFVSDKHILDRVETNKWLNIDIPADLFIANYATKHLVSANFNTTNADYPNVTEIRIGNVYGVNSANLAVEVNSNDIVSGEQTAQTTIAVSSTNETMPAYELIVKNSQGNIITATSSVDDSYTFDLVAGAYTYLVQSTDEVYLVGTVSGEFVVEDAFKIVVEDYPSYTAGNEVTLPNGVVYESGVATENVASKTAKFVYAADNTEVDLADAATFTPDYSGKFVITYTYEGANDLVVELPVGRAPNREGYILDATKDTILDIAPANANATVSYVSAEENIDETYTEGYHLVKHTSGWCNINFSNNVNFTKEDLDGYDYISIWLYLEYKNTTENNHYLSFYNAYDVDGTPTNYALKTNRWVKLNISLDAFEAKFDGLVGNTTKVAFMPFNFSASYLLGVRVGEMKLEKLESTVTYNSELSKIEMQIADFENSDYTVSIKDAEGQEVTDFEFVLDKETNAYEYAVTTSGTYTITIVYNYEFLGSNSSKVEGTYSYMIEKTYTVTL